MSRVPIIKGIKYVPKPNRIGMTTKKIIVVPCIVNMRLKTSGETKWLCGTIELYPHDRRFDTANDEKHQPVDDVENPQLLVIHGDNPVVKPVADRPCAVVN